MESYVINMKNTDDDDIPSRRSSLDKYTSETSFEST